MNNIFEINDQVEKYEENLNKLHLAEYRSEVRKHRTNLKKYLHIIEVELDDILGIFPKKIKTIGLFDKK